MTREAGGDEPPYERIKLSENLEKSGKNLDKAGAHDI